MIIDDDTADMCYVCATQSEAVTFCGLHGISTKLITRDELDAMRAEIRKNRG